MLRPVHRPGLLAGAAMALALCLVPSFADAQAPPPPLDHFWCYDIQGTSPDAPVTLRDQFDATGTPDQQFLVRNPLRFCNPVEKVNSAGRVTFITDPRGHLKLYLIPPNLVEPVRSVVVRNQFGFFQRLLTFDPLLLAVPTAKDTLLPTEKVLDHFKCYRAYGGPRNADVRLEDQFQGPSRATVLRPVLFCNPVDKRHGEVVAPIKNPTRHLVCYFATKTSMPAQRLFSTANQFGREEQLSTTVADILCVPSQKVSFTLVP